MKLFVWHCAYDSTENWHSGAGIVALANDIDEARELLKPKVRKESEVFKYDPDETIDLDLLPDPWAGVFPDAGCC